MDNWQATAPRAVARFSIALAMAAALLAGCTCPGAPPTGIAAPAPAPAAPAPATLAGTWMFGIARLRGDPEPLLPYTNRFIFDLAAMPRTQVVFLGAAPNGPLFDAYAGDKLRVAAWLHGEDACMSLTYTQFMAGQEGGSSGLIVPRLPAGTETDLACIDRAVTAFYHSLARQGF